MTKLKKGVAGNLSLNKPSLKYMKKQHFMHKYSANLLAFVSIAAIITFCMKIEVLPWWTFIIPMVAGGILIVIKKWNVACFPVGFLAGFAVWAGGNLYYHKIYGGAILGRLDLGNAAIAILFAGIIGGLLTGLALYTGKAFMQERKPA
jgi:hypothetical protein